MKSILLILVLFIFPINVKADQFFYLTYEQAIKAKNFLEKEEQVILYCGCCTDDPKTYVKIKNVTIEKVPPTSYDRNEYYTVTIDGTESFTKKPINQTLDLAYTYFIRADKKAYNLAIVLLLNADPCMIDSFEVDSRISSKKKFIEKESYYKKFSELI